MKQLEFKDHIAGNQAGENPPNDGLNRVLKGIPASPGIVMGRAFVLSFDDATTASERTLPHRISDEVDRFVAAHETAVSELQRALHNAESESRTAISIIDSYLMIVKDPMIVESITDRISSGANAEAAVAQEFDVHRSLLYGAKDPVLRSRVQDFDHIKERLIALLRNRTLSHAAGYDTIVIASSVTPQDMLFFRETQTLGYVSEIGGINSHTCILARDMGFPAVIGIRNVKQAIPHDAMLIVDGYSGIVIVNPAEVTLNEYKEKQLRAEEHRQKLGGLLLKETETSDGTKVTLLANVDTPEQAEAALIAGCEGIGLVRSEFLLIQRGSYPSSDEQFAWYKEIAERAYPKPVTIRAFDVGSDKFRLGIPHQEDNPALGLRGVRFLLYRPDIFEQQVCAVLRASVHLNVKFMIPMISTLEELNASRKMIERCKTKLRAEGIEFDENLPLGIMIETPAAALMSDLFAQHADFLSIGTNDLAQYALATDRMNEMVADIYDALHPAVLRMVKMVVDAAKKHGKIVSVCGEMAGHAAATELLVGIGIQELSVAPSLILDLKQRVLNISYNECKLLVDRVEHCSTTQEVYAELSSINQWREEGDLIT